MSSFEPDLFCLRLCLSESCMFLYVPAYDSFWKIHICVVPCDLVVTRHTWLLCLVQRQN